MVYFLHLIVRWQLLFVFIDGRLFLHYLVQNVLVLGLVGPGLECALGHLLLLQVLVELVFADLAELLVVGKVEWLGHCSLVAA